MTSAYPLPDDVLIDRVRGLATELGGWPSQRRVMRTCRVGAPRADTALTTLRQSGFNPTADAPAPVPAQALTVVPDLPDIDPDRTQQPAAEFTQEPALEPGEVHRDADRPDAPDAPAEAAPTPVEPGEVSQTRGAVDTPAPASRARVPRWPLLLIAAGAFVAIWGGWVGLGEMAGFGPIRLLPGIADGWVINSAITLPIGVEAYAAFAMRAWLAQDTTLPRAARRFACWSSLGALALGAGGQIAYHLMVAAGITAAPWPITAFVSALPVVVLGLAAILAHLIHRPDHTQHDPSGEDR